MKFLAIDPSGTGTTGMYYADLDGYQFDEFKSKEWKEHLKFIVQVIKEKKPDIVIFENTNYIYGRQHQGTVGIYKLIGGIISLQYAFDFVKEINGIFVSSVKSFRNKVQRGIGKIKGLSYEIGRDKGWKYESKRISLHQVDALIVFRLWTKENYPSQEAVKKEIFELEAKGKRIGIRQKARLKKLKNLLENY